MSYVNSFSQVSAGQLNKTEVLVGVSDRLLNASNQIESELSNTASILKYLKHYFVLISIDLSDVVLSADQQDHALSWKNGKLTRLSGLIIESDYTDLINNQRKNQQNGTISLSQLLQSKLPVIEMSDLNQVELKENFIQQSLTMSRWNQLQRKEDKTKYPLSRFHQTHSHVFQCHAPEKLVELKEIIDNKQNLDMSQVYDRYIDLALQTIRTPATRENNYSVLKAIALLLSAHVSVTAMNEIDASIEQFVSGKSMLSAPLKLMRAQVMQLVIPELMNSAYLFPYPQHISRTEVSGESAIAV
ncbi:MAG: DUF1722 domain-containing protein [Gammaproteobacteria bacterium]|nr:DUF1722 domain-containing protein [Gammaproteobacteria bacterium]